MNKIKDFFKKNKCYFISALIVTFIFILLLIVRKVYPFGDNLIASYDFYAGYVPVYYKLYDILHGTSSVLYDWNLAAGANCYGSLVANALLSPISWLIYFSPRDMIPQFLTIIFWLKLVFISITSYYAFNRFFKKVDNRYKIVYSVLYAISGYILIVFPNLIWFESIALFPLVCVGMKEVFDNKKSLLFVISLTLSLIYSYYLSYMMLLFMFCAILLGLIFYKTDNKKEVVTKLIFYIVISLCMSFFSFLPSFMQSMSSYRMSSTGVEEATKSSALFIEKCTYYFAYAFAFINFARLCTTMKKDKKSVLFYICLLFLTMIGLVIEPINKMWHTGSYQSIPHRYAFIPIFVMMLGGLHYLDNNKEKPILNIKKTWIITSLYVLFNGLLIFVLIDSFDQLTGNSIIFGVVLKTFIILLIMFLINVVIYLLVLSLKKKYMFKFLFVSIIIEIMVFSFSCDTIQILFNDGLTALDNFPVIQNDYRYKTNVDSLYPNYSYLVQLPMYQNWIHIIPESQVLTYNLLGYDHDSVVQYSSGGTYFTDLILGNKYVSSTYELNSNLYTLISKDDNFYYYKMKYSLPVYIPLNGDTYNEYDDNSFEFQNSIYKTLFNKDNDVIVKLTTNVDINENKYTYSFDYDGESDVYYYVNDLSAISSISINGENVDINRILSSKMFSFIPSSNNIIEVTFSDVSKVDENKLDFYVINMDEIKSLVNEYKDIKYTIKYNKNKLTIVYNNDNNYTRLFIPINYNDGFTIYNNDVVTKYERDINNYMSIDLHEGENVITLEFYPPYLKVGIIVSFVSLMLFILFSFINSKLHFTNNIIIKSIFYYLFFGLEIVFFLKVYIMPLFK